MSNEKELLEKELIKMKVLEKKFIFSGIYHLVDGLIGRFIKFDFINDELTIKFDCCNHNIIFHNCFLEDMELEEI